MDNKYINEIWKPIKDWENIYEVSNYGRVRRITYDSPIYHTAGELPYYIKKRYDKDGYVRYALCYRGKIKQAFAHRLVAEAFIENPNNYPVINHIDCDIKNNCVTNLEWCTIKYNNNYIKKMGRTNYAYGNKHSSSKKVLQFDKQGNFIKEYESSGHASRELGITSSQIRSCCNPNSRTKSVHSYIFKYKVN